MRRTRPRLHRLSGGLPLTRQGVLARPSRECPTEPASASSWSRADEDGAGPALRQRLYVELFVIRSGQAISTVGAETLAGRGGLIIVSPFTQHTFAKTESNRFASMNFHVNSATDNEWLEPDSKR